MILHKLETIVYAQGFIEDFVESSTEPVEINEDWNDETKQDAVDTNEHSVQVRAMMQVLSEGLDQLRRANVSLENKLALIKSAMNTPT